MDNYLHELERSIGYRIGGTWLEAVLEKRLTTNEPDRGLDFEIIVSKAVPCDVEPVRIEPSEPYPKTTPGLLALHFCGLFATNVLSMNVGGHTPGFVYLVDLNQLRGPTPIYLAKAAAGSIEILPYEYAADGSPEATAKFRDAWFEVEKVSVADPPDRAELSRKGQQFVSTYPGVARFRSEFVRRFVGSAVSFPDPAPVPAALTVLHRAFARIAPAFIAARGLPACGADRAGAIEAMQLLAEAPSMLATNGLLARTLLPWVAGDEAIAKAQAESIVAGGLGAPLAQRWAKRILGREDAS